MMNTLNLDLNMLIDVAERLVNKTFAIIPRPKPTIESVQNARIIAHRGAHNNAQGIIENTLQAFEAAKKAGCWGIEFDVRATADGVLVVNHDLSLQRLWGHNVLISELSFTQLRALEPGIPTLAEVLAQYANSLRLFIELKTPFVHGEVLKQELQGLHPQEHYYLLSLDHRIFQNLNLFPKQSLLLVAGHNNVRQFCELSLEDNYGGVLGNYVLMRNKFIKKLQNAKQKSGVGFVDSAYSLYRELNRGIEFIFTNQADSVTLTIQQLLHTL
jgi:glycerophosphoryl diester phosphodiesterase